jgi:hypothetical protein
LTFAQLQHAQQRVLRKLRCKNKLFKQHITSLRVDAGKKSAAQCVGKTDNTQRKAGVPLDAVQASLKQLL